MNDDRDLHWGITSRIRSVCAWLIGIRYRELPFGTRREDVEIALSELHAEKRREAGSPAGEITNEYFRIGRRTLQVCTEDEMFISLWGAKDLVDQIYARVVEGGAGKPAGGC